MPKAAEHPSTTEACANSAAPVATPDSVTTGQSPRPDHFRAIRRIGVAAWSIIGVIALTVLIAGGISALSGILVPLVVAVILGTVLEPVVSWLVRHKTPRVLAATLVLLAALTITVAVTFVVVNGFVLQIPEITHQMLSGWAKAMDWLRSLDINPAQLEQLRSAADGTLTMLEQGAFGAVTGTLYNTIMLTIGSFFALYFLFFVLRDGTLFPAWFARITKQDEALVAEIDGEVRESIRGYFSGTAITALITAPIFVLPLILLGIPLVVPMIVLYFFMSFIPYIGAWLTGAFAVLIAFGFGGANSALIVALALLISNGPVQNVVLAWALGSSLNIHPVMVLLSTIIGGVVAGILGMVLGPPIVSALQKAFETLREHRNRSRVESA